MEEIESLRLVVFLGLLCALVLLETFFERKERVQARSGRWLTNITMTIANTATVYVMGLLMPIMVVGAALLATRYQIGALHMIDLPLWFEAVIAVVVLDFVIWAQHLPVSYTHLTLPTIA